MKTIGENKNNIRFTSEVELVMYKNKTIKAKIGALILVFVPIAIVQIMFAFWQPYYKKMWLQLPDSNIFTYGGKTFASNLSVLGEHFRSTIFCFLTSTIFYIIFFSILLIAISVIFNAKIIKPLKANRKIISKFYLFAFLIRFAFDILTAVLMSFLSSVLMPIIVGVLFDVAIVCFSVRFLSNNKKAKLNPKRKALLIFSVIGLVAVSVFSVFELKTVFKFLHLQESGNAEIRLMLVNVVVDIFVVFFVICCFYATRMQNTLKADNRYWAIFLLRLTEIIAGLVVLFFLKNAVLPQGTLRTWSTEINQTNGKKELTIYRAINYNDDDDERTITFNVE